LPAPGDHDGPFVFDDASALDPLHMLIAPEAEVPETYPTGM
jgi:hypothetical protein